MDFSTSRQRRPRPSLTLVLPAYNEQAIIQQAIEEASDALQDSFADYEIIVVDDGSSDQTASLVLRAMQLDARIRIIRHASNQGYGAAIRAGFASATKDLVAFSDADCQFNLRELSQLAVLSESHDIVCGYRIDRKDTLIRRVYSRGYNLLVRLLLGIHVRDVDCALKLFHRDVVRDLEIRTDGFLVNSELLTQARIKGYRVIEVGVSHRPRAGGQSSVSVHHIPRVLASLLRYWWNEVQFPGESFTGFSDLARHGHRLGWSAIAVILIAALFTLTNLSYPLIDRDETRYAEIPREMLMTGNWVLPQLNHQPYYDKPPLLYWLCALSYRLFGVHEWSARLIPAASACATLAATMWFGTRWFGRRVGLYSGIALFLTTGFLFCSRYLLIDGLFLALLTISWMSGYESIRQQRLHLGWWLFSALTCGLAILAKGPLSCVLWLPPIIAHTWITRSSAKPSPGHWITWILICLSVAIPWFVLVASQDPRFPLEFLWTHNAQRFAGAFHARPFWYFIPVVLIAGHPWSSLTIPITRFLCSRSPHHRMGRSPAIGFLVLWCLWTLLFFSLCRCKLATYVLPVAPAMAMVVGVYLHRLQSMSTDWSDYVASHWSPRVALVLTCAAAFGILGFQFISDSIGLYEFTLWLAVWIAIGIAILVSLQRFRSASSAWFTTIISTLVFGAMVMHHLLPEYSRNQSLMGTESELRATVASADQVLTIGHEFAEVPFYSKRSDIEHWRSIDIGDLQREMAGHSVSLLFVSRHITMNDVQSRLPAQAQIEVILERKAGKVIQVHFDSDNVRAAFQSTRHDR